jgi:hypothetical protein
MTPITQPFDRSSKWILANHGDAALRVAGVANIAACRPADNQLVQPRQFPDSVFEVEFTDARGRISSWSRSAPTRTGGASNRRGRTP